MGFDEAVTRSVNLRGDADSHGSITGQLAGAIYGYKAINKQFIQWLSEWDDHEFALRGVLLHHVGSQRGSPSGDAEKKVEEEAAKAEKEVGSCTRAPRSPENLEE